jgi:hypothetical protein
MSKSSLATQDHGAPAAGILVNSGKKSADLNQVMQHKHTHVSEMACSPVKFDKTMSPCLDSPQNIPNATSIDSKVPPIPLISGTGRV